MKKPTGLYARFDSTIDGEPIYIAIPLRKSKNTKTGNLIPIYIMPWNFTPGESIRNGADRSVCGDCELRPLNNPKSHHLPTCYVNVHRAPTKIDRAVKHGRNYRLLDESTIGYLNNRQLRFGGWGDPAAVPIDFWQDLLQKIHITSWTGYTHRWREARFQWFRKILMASVTNEYDKTLANDMGWRTFRILSQDDALVAGELACPASQEQGHRLTCFNCMACKGTWGHDISVADRNFVSAGNIAIIAH